MFFVFFRTISKIIFCSDLDSVMMGSVLEYGDQSGRAGFVV